MSVYARKRVHITCCSFDLYGIGELTGESARKWFDYCVSLSELASHPFDEGCCNPGNTKYVLFRNCNRAFEKNLNNLKDVSLRSSANKLSQEVDIGSYAIMDAIFANDFKYCYFGCHIDFFDYDKLIEIGIKLCEITNPKYGIFFKLPFVYQPEFYSSAMGMSELDTLQESRLFNPKHVDLRDRNDKWGSLRRYREEKKHAFSNLREIYPINFINEKHLNHEVFPKITLRDWIEADSHRGTLTQITEELHMWLVPDEDLEAITIALAPSDILLCVNKEDPHRYDYGARPEDQIVLEK